ncbi:hypothetical protein GGS23DRAFT_569257 [Durotheca rogersii]|uniref:uncharacterized protein n=1 Tax=Durotheca rogersii TaxID=419775 RepID=UPI002220FEC4|nr:uncharacterized protein GGS23DRAFT_569257 [Durotheca rogersii]KAI5862747.1 hypothetical protein GGS23DRAFT_569257 [Durotheca rogersii]
MPVCALTVRIVGGIHMCACACRWRYGCRSGIVAGRWAGYFSEDDGTPNGCSRPKLNTYYVHCAVRRTQTRTHTSPARRCAV